MDKKKINFIGFWSNFDKENNLFTNILKENFEVEISETPDFIFASPLCSPFEYLKYDCVRILFTGEPLVPDFNVFDYAIGFDYLSFPDAITQTRYYRYPLCFYNHERVKQVLNGVNLETARDILNKKKYFCNFMYGHKSANGEREQLFSLISRYKRVESAGSYLNNMPDGTIIPYSERKLDFLKKCKFTIACESISYPGFVTEKLMDPFLSYSIPIYYGNSLVDKEFNPNSFINLHSFESFEAGIERVIQIDQDDALYLQMLMEQKTVSGDYIDTLFNGLRSFLLSIFAQTPNDAFRRLRHYIQKSHEQYMNEYRLFSKSIVYRIYKKVTKKQ